MTAAPRTATARLLPLVAGAALLLSGCGGPEPASREAAFPAGGGGTTVDVVVSDLGNVLVGQDGRTLYAFEAAGSGPCVDDCAVAWPPYLAEGVPGAANAAYNALLVHELGTVARPDGALQVTYRDRPLHHYAGETGAGGTGGQGRVEFDRTWGAVAPGGDILAR